MVSAGVSFVVSGVTRIASFRQSFLALQWCCIHVLPVGQHSVEVDPRLSQKTCSSSTTVPSNVTAGIGLPAALL